VAPVRDPSEMPSFFGSGVPEYPAIAAIPLLKLDPTKSVGTLA
jgi:hypothetical protein